MGNCIHTMRSKHGNIVRDLDDASTKKIKESPQLEVAEQKTGKRRCVKIILTRKQLEQLLLKCPEGVSFKLPETYGSCNRKWKPSLQPIVEVDNLWCGFLVILLYYEPRCGLKLSSRRVRTLKTTRSSSWILLCKSCIQKKNLVICKVFLFTVLLMGVFKNLLIKYVLFIYQILQFYFETLGKWHIYSPKISHDNIYTRSIFNVLSSNIMNTQLLFRSFKAEPMQSLYMNLRAIREIIGAEGELVANLWVGAANHGEEEWCWRIR